MEHKIRKEDCVTIIEEFVVMLTVGLRLDGRSLARKLGGCQDEKRTFFYRHLFFRHPFISLNTT